MHVKGKKKLLSFLLVVASKVSEGCKILIRPVAAISVTIVLWV